MFEGRGGRIRDGFLEYIVEEAEGEWNGNGGWEDRICNVELWYLV
jgi:hypothetical protein